MPYLITFTGDHLENKYAYITDNQLTELKEEAEDLALKLGRPTYTHPLKNIARFLGKRVKTDDFMICVHDDDMDSANPTYEVLSLQGFNKVTLSFQPTITETNLVLIDPLNYA